MTDLPPYSCLHSCQSPKGHSAPSADPLRVEYCLRRRIVEWAGRGIVIDVELSRPQRRRKSPVVTVPPPLRLTVVTGNVVGTRAVLPVGQSVVEGTNFTKRQQLLLLLATGVGAAVLAGLGITIKGVGGAVLVRLRGNGFSADEHLINGFFFSGCQPVHEVPVPIAIAAGIGDRRFH